MSAPAHPLRHQPYFPALRPAWLALHHEEVIDPELPIVDAHHHLWETPGFAYACGELLADARSGHNVRTTVFVDCGSHYRELGPEALRPVGETEFVVAQTAGQREGKARLCAGIVGWADLRLGTGVQQVLEQHIEAGQGCFRGVRSRATWHADPVLNPAVGSANGGQPGLLLEPPVQQAAKLLGQLDLSLDVWVFHTQLQDVARLATACPQTRLVLNHCGGPIGVGPFQGRRGEVLRDWHADMRTLAAHDNIVVKLGGLAMPRMGFGFHEAAIPVGSVVMATAWAPYIEACVAAFGVERCMFESNFPVDKVSCSYVAVWNAFKHVTQACSAAEKTALFSETATRVYRL